VSAEESGAGLGHTDLRAFWAELPREGRWLLSTTAVQLLGRGLTLPFTIIYLHEVRGIGLDVAGSLMAWLGLVGFLVTGPGGAAVDRYGARAVTLFGCSTQFVGVTILAFADTVPTALVAMTLMGITAITWPAFNAFIAAIVSGPVRQTYFGVSFALVNLGIGVGGLIGGVYVDVHRPGTFTTIYLLDAASMLIPIGLLLGPLRHVKAKVERPADEDARSGSYLRILRQPAFAWLIGLTLIANFIGYGQMEAGMPAFAREASQVSTRVIGWAFAANTAIIVVTQMFVIGRISGRRRTRVLLVMAGVWATAWLLLGATGVLPGGLFAALGVIAFHFVFGFGETLLQPTIPAMTNDLAPDHLRGRYNALSSGAFQAGGVLGPLAAGFLLRHELSTLYIAIMVAGCAAMVWATLVLERRLPARANGLAEASVSRE
jgi:MFS family permease